MSDVQIAVEVLYKQGNIAETLMLVDDYMQRINKLGSKFKLPRADAWMLPILERYAYDLRGFVQFVKAICEDWANDTTQRPAVNAFYRTLVVRIIQQLRRDRLAQALAWLDKHHPGLTVTDRKLWLGRIEQQWKLRRLNLLKSARIKTQRGRLSLVEREELLAEFWAGIEAEIAEGRLPPPG